MSLKSWIRRWLGIEESKPTAHMRVLELSYYDNKIRIFKLGRAAYESIIESLDREGAPITGRPGSGQFNVGAFRYIRDFSLRPHQIVPEEPA